MCKVTNLSPEPIKSLIPPSAEVNTDDIADKSSSETNVQHVTQSKATTDKKSKKKKNLASSKPKTLKTIGESSPSPQVANTQPAEEPTTTANVTYSIDASELIRNDTLRDAKFQKTDFDLESMPKDELESLSGFKADKIDSDDHQCEHKDELSKTNEAVINNMIDELVDMGNSKDVNLNDSADKLNESDPLVIFIKKLAL
nr:hypothetical protein [Tanacetum cinerariifolium]